MCSSDLKRAKVFAVIWDSSPFGYGTVIRCHSDRDGPGTLVVGTFDDRFDVSEQVYREAVGGYLAVEAAARLFDLHDSVLILRNDSSSALAALRKGSSASSTLQACASRLAITCSDLCAAPYFLHAPGDTLIAEGIDDASRSLARGIKGPSCNQTLKTYIFASAKRLGWHISVDAFASAYNRLVERYYAEFPEPDAEAVDALAVTDWNSSVCPSCGRPHREVVFA